MALPDLEIHCDDPDQLNIAEYPYYITEPGFQ